MTEIYRPTWMEVSLATIGRNYANLKNYVSEGTEVISVIKGNAYGMGMVRTANALRDAGCSYFAVATPDEAYELRKSGISEKIIVIGPGGAQAARMYAEQNIETICGDDEFFEILTACSVPVGVHFKIDTGLGRSGFSCGHFAEKSEYYLNHPKIRTAGIMSHFAVADEGPNRYTVHQFERFRRVLDGLPGQAAGIRHICNSAAALHYPSMHLDAVRVGKLLYGFWPACDKRPFVSEYPFKIRSQISAIRQMRLNETFGYGLRYACRDCDRIAIVPIGYADGYTRLYMGRTSALVRGMRVPVVGSVCCDQIFLKVTGVPGVSCGDEVLLVGCQDDATIWPEELGSAIGTSACEVISLFRGRMPRRYREDME